MLDTLFDLPEEDMVMVTGVASPARSREGLQLLVDVLRMGPGGAETRVLQVIAASGPHSGRVGFVPAFWLRVVVPAGG
jgi:hypothetical protein